ncbi:MAG: hypothetical protein ACI9IV_001394 [Paracoccaceae bacterium]|jgi:hypothetical protein
MKLRHILKGVILAFLAVQAVFLGSLGWDAVTGTRAQPSAIESGL